MSALFEDNAWVIWVGVALALGAIEAATVDFIFIMLAGGALGGAVAAGLGASFPIQAIVAALTAIVLLTTVRPWVKRRFAPHTGPATIGVAGNVGRAVVVLETVDAAGGRVRLGGETWSARSAAGVTLEVGTEARVVAIDGATAVVAPVPPLQDH